MFSKENNCQSLEKKGSKNKNVAVLNGIKNYRTSHDFTICRISSLHFDPMLTKYSCSTNSMREFFFCKLKIYHSNEYSSFANLVYMSQSL